MQDLPFDIGTEFTSTLMPSGTTITVLQINSDANELVVTHSENQSFSWNLTLTLEGFVDGEYNII
jgi:hypothetical protein